jgi:hypothetical protein
MRATSAMSPSAVQSSSASPGGRSGGSASGRSIAAGSASSTWPLSASSALAASRPRGWTQTVQFAPISAYAAATSS